MNRLAARSYPFSTGQPPGLVDSAYTRLRAEEPVSRVRLPYGDEAWLVTGYEIAKEALIDPRLSRAAIVGRNVARDRPETIKNAANILNMDPPGHTRLRKLVAKAFTVSRIEELRPHAQTITNRLLDEMAGRIPPVDLVELVGRPLAVSVICELLGVPVGDHRAFEGRVDIVYSYSATPEQRQIARDELISYIAGMIAERRRKPTDDLLGALVMARDKEDRLSDDELLTTANGILMAGQSSIPHLIGSFIYLLLTHPGQLARVQANMDLIADAIEELLRFSVLVPAAQVSRIATEEIRLGNVTVRTGETVLVALHAANRDPAVFADPEALLVDRTGNPHISFGRGPHYCLGVHLVRMELQVAVGSLLRRFPRLALAVPPDSVEWRPDTVAPVPCAMPITWMDYPEPVGQP